MAQESDLAAVVSSAASDIGSFIRTQREAAQVSVRQLAERALGDAPAELWVFDGNPRAEAFYRKLGFERDGAEATHRETGLHGIRMVRGG